MVKLGFWREFARCEVVKLDESRTGASLPISENGVVEFKSNPHRMITFWLRD